LVGLCFDVVGAIILAMGLFISKKSAVELSVSRLSGETPEENLQLPAVKDRLRQSHRAMIALPFLVAGFVLQLVGDFFGT
jgi:hypothetical protein